MNSKKIIITLLITLITIATCISTSFADTLKSHKYLVDDEKEYITRIEPETTV